MPVGEIKGKAVEAGMKEGDVEDMLMKLKTLGEILEVTDGRYKVI